MQKLLSQEHRCQCGKLLLKGIIFDGSIEIKCRRCGTVNKIGEIKMSNDDSHYLLIINNDGMITNASSSASRILGYSNEELIGQHYTLINPLMTKEICAKYFGSGVLGEDNYLKLEVIHKAKDGRSIPITAVLKLFLLEDGRKYISLAASLNDAAAVDRNLAKDPPEFQNNACDFYFDLDKDGLVEYISPMVHKLFGFIQDKIVGRSYFDHLPSRIRAKSKSTFAHFSAAGRPYRELNCVEKGINGNKLHLDLYFTPRFNDFGRFIGYRVLGWVIKTAK
jgi:PAS domain S-box-containing protein